MAAQPLNHADRMAIRPLLIPRITAMVTHYAVYLLNNAEATADQTAWAKQAALSPGPYADHVSYHVLSQDAFLENGSGIADATLSGIVETALNTHFIPAS